MMWGFYNYGPGSLFGFGWIFMLLFWGLIIWGVVALFRSAAIGTYDNKKGEDTAMAVLKERYAKGEISKEEYEEKKKGISN